jgi:fatty acid desaturase
MITSGFKQKQLGEIRRETSYPLLRTYIASIRVTALLVASFIGLLALLGIGGAWFTLVISEPVAAKRQIGTDGVARPGLPRRDQPIRSLG